MEEKHNHKKRGLYYCLIVHVFTKGGCLRESEEQLWFLQHYCIISSNTEYAKPLAGNNAASKYFNLKIQRCLSASCSVDELLFL